MSPVRLPAGMELVPLARNHSRRHFSSGQPPVDDWLRTKALQHQEKHLSVTKVLVAKEGIVGFYTLASGQVDFGDLPSEIAREVPKRALPVAVLAWLGVSAASQGKKLGTLLVAQALRDCYEASRTFPFVAVILDKPRRSGR